MRAGTIISLDGKRNGLQVDGVGPFKRNFIDTAITRVEFPSSLYGIRRAQKEIDRGDGSWTP